MKNGRNLPRKALVALVMAGVGFSVVPSTAAAQDDARLRKIEAELRAVQRVVFPNSDGRFFTPEVSTQQNSTQQVQTPAGAPATSALTDMLVRMEAVEGQLARITAANEENSAALRTLQSRLAQLEASAAAPAPVAAQPFAAVQNPAIPTGTPPATATTRPAGPVAPIPVGTSPAASAPSAARLAGVQAILKPETADAGDDEYTYGFRLWEAKFYPEARQQLALFLERYPRHKQASFGRNLLGRAYLDDGDVKNAATHFLANYQADKQGARAGDSLLYLAEAMISLNDKDRACIALATFGDEYPALAVGRLKAQYDRNRGKVSCN